MPFYADLRAERRNLSQLRRVCDVEIHGVRRQLYICPFHRIERLVNDGAVSERMGKQLKYCLLLPRIQELFASVQETA